MLQRIDDCFLSWANKTLKITRFFGLTRLQTINWWVWTTACLVYMPLTIHLDVVILISILFGGSFLIFCTKLMVYICYRDDDMLANSPLLTNRLLRLTAVFSLILCGFVVGSIGLWPIFQNCKLTFHYPKDLVMILPKLLSHNFWIYFVLCQDSKDRETIKDFAKSLVKKVKSVLRPARPILQPTSLTINP